MRQTNLTAALLILSAFVLSGATCNRVVVSDNEICGDKGELGASCFYMLSDRSRKLSFDDWASERFGQLCMKADAFANLKASLLKLCEETGRCTWEEIQDINSLGNKVSLFQEETRGLK